MRDAEYQATLLDDAEAAQGFDSFLWHWLQKCRTSKVTLFIVPSFTEHEFMITPEKEFYVSAALGEIIREIFSHVLSRQQRQLSTLIISDN